MSHTSADQPFWIVLGDIHDQTARLAELPILTQAQGIIVSGDLTLTGGITQARVVMDALRACNPNVLAQVGNMDRPEVTDWLAEQHCNLHSEVRELTPDIALMGVGASTFTPFGTPSEYPETWFAEKLEHMWHAARRYKHAVLIAHNPPAGTVCDQIGGEQHVGSTAVREFIEDAQPALCICGHIHEARGTDRIGRTHILNPGAFLAGGYAVLSLDPNGKPCARLCALDE